MNNYAAIAIVFWLILVFQFACIIRLNKLIGKQFSMIIERDKIIETVLPELESRLNTLKIETGYTDEQGIEKRAH